MQNIVFLTHAFLDQIFWTQHLLNPNIFGPKILLDQSFFGQNFLDQQVFYFKIIGTQNFVQLGPKPQSSVEVLAKRLNTKMGLKHHHHLPTTNFLNQL